MVEQPRGVTRADWMALALLAGVLAFAFAGTRGLWEPAEGWTAREAERRVMGVPFPTGEMALGRGDSGAGGPAARVAVEAATLGRRLFGRHEAALRFGSGLFYLAMTLVAAGLGALAWRRRDRAWRAAAFFALSPLAFHRATLLAEPGTPLLGWAPLMREWWMPAGLLASAALAVALAGRGRGGRPGRIFWSAALGWSVLLLAARLIFATLPSDRDARLMALALPKPDGMVLVNLDDREHPGLGWYLRCEIVNVAWDDSTGAPPPAGRVPLGRLLDTMRPDPDRPHVFLLPGPDVPQLTQILQADGLTVVDRRAVGRLGALLVYRVVPHP